METLAVTVGDDSVHARRHRSPGTGLGAVSDAWHCLCFWLTGAAARRSVQRRRPPESAMLRMRNKYCSNCLRTTRFLDLGTYLVCESCSKRLERILPVRDRQDREIGVLVPWSDRGEPRREAM